MTLSSQTEIHYHYDAEGRLISETNGASGESLRDYVWLGLTPIASFGAANDNAAAEDCTEDLAALDANIEDRTSRIDTNAARIPELGDLAADKQARIAGHTARIAALGELIEDRQARITALTTRAAELTALAADLLLPRASPSCTVIIWAAPCLRPMQRGKPSGTAGQQRRSASHWRPWAPKPKPSCSPANMRTPKQQAQA